MKRYNHESKKRLLVAAIIMVCCSLFTSCSSYKNVAYMKDIKDSETNVAVASLATTYTDPKILPNDILQITVQTLDPQTNNILSASTNNAVPQSPIPSINQAAAAGYMVDRNGFVQIPLVGMVKVGGLTTMEARDLISQKVAKYYIDPVVNVRLSNFTIEVLGEVNHPSTYVVNNEKVDILDAISMAGDLTIYGKRENVMLVRDENGTKKFVRFNLNSSEIFTSPYYYLRQGDKIYVEPNKAKAANTDMAKSKNIALMGSAFSVLIVLLSRINF